MLYSLSMQQIRNMPIGIQSFEAMRTGSYIYVDKSQFIPKLEVLGRAYFLARPRRFGKSLFLSTLQAYFEGRKELFKGLAIEKYKEENGQEWQNYPVLKLDLNTGDYKDIQELNNVLDAHIKDWCNQFGLEQQSCTAHLNFAYIIKSLYKKYNQKVVILVDEYDKPLIATLENKELHEAYRSTLKAFYSVIKSSNDYLHLSFLTGVTKFSKVSIFSDLNNLYDISFTSEYSTLCGITQEELERNFSVEIEQIAKEYGVSYPQMIAKLKQKYDGYHFSKQMIGIYNPFSLCNALQDKELKDYWFSSGTPTFMVRLLEENAFDIPDLEGNMRVDAKNIDDYRIDYANMTPLLFQAGYLTIKDYEKDDDIYVLGYPNDEVKYAFLYSLAIVYTRGKASVQGEFRIGLFKDAMKQGNIEKVLTLIKALLASIPYDSFSKDKVTLREYTYQTTIYLIFRLMGQYVRTEVHSSKGRSDVEVETKDAIYIFEFKVGGKPIDALAQIKEAGYAEKYEASGKNVFLIGATISRNKRTLSKWQIEKVVGK